MEKSVQITTIIVAGILLLAVFGFWAFTQYVPAQTNTISSNGQASVDITPDLVTVYFNVQTKGATSEEATTANSEIVDDLTLGLIREGFSSDDIKTEGFNVYPDYDYINGQRVSKGYSATHQVIVKMSTSETSRIGKAIDAGVEAGAGISYINFELSPEEQSKAKAEAIKLAAQDAKTKAEAMADGAGKRLGKLVSISDSSFNYSPWVMYSGSGLKEDMAVAREATTNIQPSDRTVSANVRTVYKLI